MSDKKASRPKRGAPPGNQYGIKLKDKEIRQLAYKSYCEHLAKGKSKDSWVFRHGEYVCCYKTFQKYLEDVSEFPPIHKDAAFADGYREWENVVEGSAKGINTKANTASLQMLMRNKYGWDKADKQADVDANTVNQFNAIMNQLSQAQAKKKD